MKCGICLAGGGVKGAAHIGALKALEEEGINIERISGTSSGSIVATLYAANYSTEEILNIFNKYSKKIKYIDLKNIINIIKRIFQERRFLIEGFNSGEIIENMINELCMRKGIENIKDIKNNLLIASVSINTGKVYFFKNMQSDFRYSDGFVHIQDINIGKAVRASCSFPGVFCPCPINNDLLVDGGIRENVPWKEMKEKGIDKVLCITFEEDRTIKKYKNIIDIVSGSISLMGRELSNYELNGADNILTIKTKEVSLLDFREINYLYTQGYSQTKKFLKKYLSNACSSTKLTCIKGKKL